jgi:3-hydroxybutyryl-CoA dehydratase
VSQSQLFARDMKVGDRWDGISRELTQADFATFAGLTGDRHPIHYDADYAATTRFGRPVAHGLLLVGLTALGAAAVSERIRDAMIALVAQDAEFVAPAMVGDTVTSAFECAAIEPARRPNRSRVTISVTLTNQNGSVLLTGRHHYLLLTAPPDAGAA